MQARAQRDRVEPVLGRAGLVTDADGPIAVGIAHHPLDGGPETEVPAEGKSVAVTGEIVDILADRQVHR